MERAATPEETAKIAALIGEAVDAGALASPRRPSTSLIGFEGKPLACRNAAARSQGLRQPAQERGKGAIEIALTPPGRRAGAGPVRVARLPARKAAGR